jgi:hypothetical protein
MVYSLYIRFENPSSNYEFSEICKFYGLIVTRRHIENFIQDKFSENFTAHAKLFGLVPNFFIKICFSVKSKIFSPNLHYFDKSKFVKLTYR